jgi:hypothetical protein
MNQKQQQQLKCELSIAQILANSSTGDAQWVLSRNGKHDSDTSRRLQNALHVLKDDYISNDIVIELNDSDVTFDEIAIYLGSSDKFK